GITVTVTLEAGAGEDRLLGPDEDARWLILGQDRGTLGTIEFGGVESLEGAANNHDDFVFGAHGALSGRVEGGHGGFDSVILDGGAFERVVYAATGPDSGTIERDGSVIAYAGMEPVVDGSATPNRVFRATIIGDTVR